MLNLSLWNGVIPVLLPLGQPTIAPIAVASAGVAVPFLLYVLGMFMLIVPIWMHNFENDKKAQGQPLQPHQQMHPLSISVGGGEVVGLYGPPAEQDYPSEFRLRPGY